MTSHPAWQAGLGFDPCRESRGELEALEIPGDDHGAAHFLDRRERVVVAPVVDVLPCVTQARFRHRRAPVPGRVRSGGFLGCAQRQGAPTSRSRALSVAFEEGGAASRVLSTDVNTLAGVDHR